MIVVHCSATREDCTLSPEDLDRLHRRRGFNGTGYHYYIRKDGTVHLTRPIERIWRRRVVRIVCRSRPHRILDVATGTGDLAIEMARRIRDVHVLGVDLSEKMLDVARCKVAARGLDERVVLDVGDAEIGRAHV